MQTKFLASPSMLVQFGFHERERKMLYVVSGGNGHLCKPFLKGSYMSAVTNKRKVKPISLKSLQLCKLQPKQARQLSPCNHQVFDGGTSI